MEQIIELMKEINIAQIIVIFTGGWFFFNRLDQKINRQINRLDYKIEKIEEKIDDIDKRLCRIEGSLATQGHCLFHQQHDKKAE